VTVTVTRCSIAVVAAIVVGGCSGGEEQGKLFTPADATRIGNVRPVTPGWTWPAKQDKLDAADSKTEAQADPNDVLLVELNKQTGDLVEIGTGGGRWRDNEKLANLSVQVFGSASDAHELMAPLNAFSRGWGKVAGRITKDEEIDGLGDEAWRLWSEGNGTEVTYHWRRGNLFVEAHVDCFGYCPGNVDAATRAWVDAIDEAARTGS
jgi:hypothetical protein